MSIFPTINNISDVIPSIQGYDEFIIADKHPFKIINYTVNYLNSFDDDGKSYCDACKKVLTLDTWHCGSQRCPEWIKTYKIRRECRGLVFDALTGKIISRRYHKFFNLNENEENRNVDFSKPHVILEKLDGSMISVVIHPETKKLVCLTKMGLTDTAYNAEVFLYKKENVSYIDFCSHIIAKNHTPIFEWCSRKNRIVIDYPEDRLILTAIRNNVTGEYYSYSDMIQLAVKYNIDYVKTVKIDTIDQIKTFMDMEGVVIRFSDGNMIKIKADDYVLKHKTKESVVHEKTIIEIILNDGIDDIIPLLDSEYAQKISDFKDSVNLGLQNRVQYLDQVFDKYYCVMGYSQSKKSFAMSIQDLHGHDKSILFEKYKDPNIDTMKLIHNLIRKNISSQSKVDNIRYVWGGSTIKLTNNLE